MKHNSFFSSLFILSFIYLLFSCSDLKPNSESNYQLEKLNSLEKIIGTWEGYTNEIYSITEDSIETFNSYSGKNLYIKKISEDSAYIYFQYVKALCNEHSDFENYIYTYDDDSLDSGKWYAICYKQLSENAVKLSAAYSYTSPNSFDTLEEAVENFTIENGYFSYFSDCVKK